MCCIRETLTLKKATLILRSVSTFGITHLTLFNTDLTEDDLHEHKRRINPNVQH